MDAFTVTTLGVWKRGKDKLVAAYFDDDAIRVSQTIAGARVRRADGVQVLTERQWLELYDKLRESGWMHA